MKIVIINTLNRDVPAGHPPYAPLSLTSYLRHHGVKDVAFVNVDYNPYSIDDLVQKR